MTVEQEILRQISEGGRGAEIAVEKLYRDKGGQFKGHFMKMGLNKQDAEDVLQQTMLKILKRARTYLGFGSANGWLWRVARNTLTDRLRELQRRGRREFSESALEAESENAGQLSQSVPGVESASLLQRCYDQCMARFRKEHPERYETLMWKVDGYGDVEISERLGRSHAATRQYISQCRKILKPYLADCDGLGET